MFLVVPELLVPQFLQMSQHLRSMLRTLVRPCNREAHFCTSLLMCTCSHEYVLISMFFTYKYTLFGRANMSMVPRACLAAQHMEHSEHAAAPEELDSYIGMEAQAGPGRSP